jgi:type IV secretory system VirB3-like protein
MAIRERRNAVFKSLHKPLLILGIERKMFAGVLAATYLMHFATDSARAAAGTFLITALAGRFVTEKDSIYFRVLLQYAKFKKIYDAAKYEPPAVEILRAP